MAESRVELVRRLWDEWNRGDRESGLDPEITHPDIELHTRFSSLQGEPYRGYEGLRQWMHDIDEQFDEWQVVAGEIREHGNRVLVLGQIHLRGRESGVELDQPFGWIVDFRDDRFVRLETHLTHEEAIAAAGAEFAEDS
jgi:ketosteroid isomerase-like protein